MVQRLPGMRDGGSAGRLREVRRRLFNLLAGVSLLLCVVTIIIWLECLHDPRMLAYDWLDTGDAHVELKSISWLSAAGCTSLTFEREIADWQNGADEWRTEQHGFQSAIAAIDYSGPVPFWVRHGFIFQSGRWRDNSVGLTYVSSEIGLPYWFLATLFAIPPILWAKGRIRRRRTALRIRARCCTRCGYDLRATPDRCPECGSVPKASTPE